MKETMERKGMHVLLQREGSIKYLNIHPTDAHPPRINQVGPSLDTPSLWQGFIKEKLFEQHVLVESLIPSFPHLFLTFGDLGCAAIRIS